jgi:DNA-binding response OmpR family regulator
MPATLLIVEDHADLRELLAEFLKLEGFAVITAEDGEVALRLIRQQPPDLVITDIGMPRLDGISLIRELRRSPETSNLPVLVLTAYRTRSANEAMQAGATQTAFKPMQLNALLRMIKELL